MTEHTPTPWICDSEGILPISRDGVSIVARIPNHPDNKANWDADAAFIVKAANNHDALVSALSEALAVIQDCVGYSHSGDPWEENAFDMGELDIHDYARDGRLEKARAILSHLSEVRGSDA